MLATHAAQADDAKVPAPIAPALHSATSGMIAAQRRMDAAAHNVANEGTPGSPELVSDFVEATVLAPAAFKLNARVARAAADTQRALLDVLA